MNDGGLSVEVGSGEGVLILEVFVDGCIIVMVC